MSFMYNIIKYKSARFCNNNNKHSLPGIVTCTFIYKFTKSLQQPSEIATIMLLMLQRRKLSHRKMKLFAQGR